MPQIEDRVFIGFVIAATLAMMWIASPFFGAILWGLVAAIVFMPVNQALQRGLGGHRNTAAGLTLSNPVGWGLVGGSALLGALGGM